MISRTILKIQQSQLHKTAMFYWNNRVKQCMQTEKAALLLWGWMWWSLCSEGLPPASWPKSSQVTDYH